MLCQEEQELLIALIIPVFAILINKLIDEFKIYENSDQFINTKKNIFSIVGKFLIFMITSILNTSSKVYL